MTRAPLRLSALLLTLCALLLSADAFAFGGRGRAPRPDGLGPFAVGRETIAITDPTRSRTLTVDVWYPVDPSDANGPPSVYDLVFTGLPSEVALAGVPASSEGPFPLVVFSHGNQGIRFQSFFLCETLASHGFVVAAPDHAGNTALDLLNPGTPFQTRDRPLDVSFVIDEMLARSANPADSLSGRISRWRIGVTGHSFGGFTALAVASGFEDVPPDPRVRVIVPMSPASNGLSDEALGSIDLQTLIVGGTADITTPIEPNSVRPFELISGRPRYRVDVVDAGHNSFTDICVLADTLIGAGLPPNLLDFILGSVEEGCAPELIPFEEAHRLTNLYVVSFLQRNIGLDPRYRRYLTPGAARKEPSLIFYFVAGNPHCGLGFELAFLLPPLMLLRRRLVSRPARRPTAGLLDG